MDTGLTISIIAAVAQNGAIGKDGRLPWHLKGDFKRFAQLTKGHTVIAGRKTHESILKRNGQPLKDRLTVVLTNQANYEAPLGCAVAHNLEEALRHHQGKEEVFIIGGAEVYRLALPYADRIYLTEVHTVCEGDVFFPRLNEKEWRTVSTEYYPRDAENDFNYTFKVLERKLQRI